MSPPFVLCRMKRESFQEFPALDSLARGVPGRLVGVQQPCPKDDP